jgi:nucleotide-binding universal stress UspA family protein
MMKNILFPTDFSEAAERAFIYALHIADKFNAAITTLHVFQKPDIRGSHIPFTFQDIIKDFDLLEFENYKDSIPSLVKTAEEYGFAHLEMRHALEEGRVVDTILEVAGRDKADLIVMGTTGARGLKELLIGSVTGEIIENADCPVLGVPEAAYFSGRIDRIAFTTSFQEEEKKALETVRRFARPFGAHVHCINVDLAHTESIVGRMEKLKKEYAGQNDLSFTVLDGIDIREEVTKFLDAYQVDILAMVTHKRTFLQELFHFSLTKAMSYHSKVPVLSLKLI